MLQNITIRQNSILAYIAEYKKVTREDIEIYLEQKGFALSKASILRDINTLVAQSYVIRIGSTKNTQYSIHPAISLHIPFDVDTYFTIEVDKRTIVKTFDFNIFTHITNTLFTEEEKKKCNTLTETYRTNKKALSPTIIEKEMQRITVEFSWKSSSIEGNTYSLLDTEILLQENIIATGKTQEETDMIINHKKTLNYILEKPEEYKNISVKQIKEIHTLLTHNLSITQGLRRTPVGIIGTIYKPLDTIYQIEEALEKLVISVNTIENPVEKALCILLMISYIQPFEDANKRTARMLGNALLLAYNCCPLSYRNVSVTEYKKAILLFYEQHSIIYFKKLFIEQYSHAVHTYFLA